MFELYRLGKQMSWPKRSQHTTLRYNEYVTITGIPEAESNYKIGGRSPLEWVIDRYYVKTDKASGIVNDPNDWLREQHKPRYVVDLIRSLITVSMHTQELVAALPTYDPLE